MTPEGIADQLGAAGVAFRAMSAEFAVGAATQEQVLAERLGLPVDPARLQLAGAAGRASEATGARPRLVATTDPTDS